MFQFRVLNVLVLVQAAVCKHTFSILEHVISRVFMTRTFTCIVFLLSQLPFAREFLSSTICIDFFDIERCFLRLHLLDLAFAVLALNLASYAARLERFVTWFFERVLLLRECFFYLCEVTIVLFAGAFSVMTCSRESLCLDF